MLDPPKFRIKEKKSYLWRESNRLAVSTYDLIWSTTYVSNMEWIFTPSKKNSLLQLIVLWRGRGWSTDLLAIALSTESINGCDVLQNCMKYAFQRCSSILVSKKIANDLKFAKRIAEDFRRYGWNKNLPHGYRLIQDIETRFWTIYIFSFVKGSRNHLPNHAISFQSLISVLP